MIAINEYYVSIRTQDDIQMMENIDKAKLYDSGDTQIIPVFNGNIEAYKKQLLIRLKMYGSNIKLNKFKLSNASSKKRQAGIRIRLSQLDNERKYLQIIESGISYVIKYATLNQSPKFNFLGYGGLESNNNNNSNNMSKNDQVQYNVSDNERISKITQMKLNSDTISEHLDNITDDASECVPQLNNIVGTTPGVLVENESI